MTISEQNLSPDALAALRERQAGQVRVMGHHELAACYAGFPPAERCIATPEAFRDALARGDIAASPLSRAADRLAALVGEQSPHNLGAVFSRSASAPGPPDTDLAILVKPDGMAGQS